MKSSFRLLKSRTRLSDSAGKSFARLTLVLVDLVADLAFGMCGQRG